MIVHGYSLCVNASIVAHAGDSLQYASLRILLSATDNFA